MVSWGVSQSLGIRQLFPNKVRRDAYGVESKVRRQPVFDREKLYIEHYEKL
jgi:hypothetical protein